MYWTRNVQPAVHELLVERFGQPFTAKDYFYCIWFKISKWAEQITVPIVDCFAGNIALHHTYCITITTILCPLLAKPLLIYFTYAPS